MRPQSRKATLYFCSIITLISLHRNGSFGAEGPEAPGWFAGDPHVHRDCGGVQGGVASFEELLEGMKAHDLTVISVLADMGNGEVRDAEKDLPRIDGKDDPASTPHRILHWDAEWHFDPKGVTFDQKAIGGHLILLGLNRARTMFSESTHPILRWAKKQGAITGFAHLQYLETDDIPNSLSCCLPLEYPVEVALGMVDFLMEDVEGRDTAINTYYRLLNCGFRPGLVAATDFPCNHSEPLGTLLTYVNTREGTVSYRKWIQGIAEGRTVVSRKGHQEFLDLRVDRTALPGDELALKGHGTVPVSIRWTTSTPLTGTIELVRDGRVVASQPGSASPGAPLDFETRQSFFRSGWLGARRMDKRGHQTHTGAVFVTVNKAPIRASASDAVYFVRYIDFLIQQISPNGEWAQYFPKNRAAALSRYRKAKAVYLRIARAANKLAEPQNPAVTLP